MVDSTDVVIALEWAQTIEESGHPTAAGCVRACAGAAAQHARLVRIELVALHVISSRRDGIVADKAVLDRLSDALEATV